MTLSRALARRWMRAAQAPPPDHVAQSASLHLADVVGVGLAAAALDQGAAYRRFARTAPTGRVATLAGVRVADAATAAMIDGGLIHALEFDDTHMGAIVHGGAVVAAAALATAQRTGAGWSRMLRAYALGYEALIAMGLAAPGAFQATGFQVTSVAGPLAAALVAADLLDLDETTRVHAVGIALSQSSGVFEFLSNGASVKSLHPGWAAQGGVTAARLAQAGLTGPETALEGQRGLYAVFARDRTAPARLDALLGRFGDDWRLPEVAFKFLPCCHYLHPFVEAAQTLAARRQGREIAEIALWIAPGAAGVVCEPWGLKQAPRDGHAMRWSLPLVVARALLGGAVDHRFFAAPPPADALALAARARWSALEPNRFPQAFEARVALVYADGSQDEARVDDAFGGPARPATVDAARAKFRANAALGAPDCAAALDAFFFDDGARGVDRYADLVAPLAQGDAG
jgi:2-methylcitrate dehydratase PrpD